MKKYSILFILFCFFVNHDIFGQVSVSVNDENLVTKSADAKADAENAWVSVTPGPNKSFVDKSGRVVSGGGLNWTINGNENTPSGATFRAPMPNNSQNKTYTSRFRGTFAGSGGGNPVNWNVQSIISVKDAVLEVSEVSFTNGFQICQDDGTLISTPQWQKGYFASAVSNPVGYTRNTTMSVTVKFMIDNPTYLGNNTVWVRGTCSRGTNFPETQATVAGSVATATNNCGTVINMVDYDSNMAFAWEYKLRQGDSWRSCGTSNHELFVTLNNPQNTFKARSVFYLACKNTGATTWQQAFDNTWNSFVGRNVKIWEKNEKNYSRTMYYYLTPGADGIVSVSEMFKNTNNQGQCHAWMEFLQQTLLAHGLPNWMTRVYPPTIYNGFGVKNLSVQNGNVQSLPGIPGQNIQTPTSKLFSQHFIVRGPDNNVNGNVPMFFDPSYGVVANSNVAYTNISVDAWLYGNSWIKDLNAILGFGFTYQ
jgi:hypothetical protein